MTKMQRNISAVSQLHDKFSKVKEENTCLRGQPRTPTSKFKEATRHDSICYGDKNTVVNKTPNQPVKTSAKNGVPISKVAENVSQVKSFDDQVRACLDIINNCYCLIEKGSRMWRQLTLRRRLGRKGRQRHEIHNWDIALLFSFRNQRFPSNATRLRQRGNSHLMLQGSLKVIVSCETGHSRASLAPYRELKPLRTFRSDYDYEYEYEYEFFNVYPVRMPECVRLSRQLVLSSKSRRRLDANYEIFNKSPPPTTSSLRVQRRAKRLVFKGADTLWNVPCNLSRNVLATLWHLVLFVY